MAKIVMRKICTTLCRKSVGGKVLFGAVEEKERFVIAEMAIGR